MAKTNGTDGIIVFDEFAFVRPWCLLLLPVIVGLAVWLSVSRPRSAWANYIPREKLAHLLVSQSAVHPIWRWLIVAGWVIGCLALSGPSLNNLSQVAEKNRETLVILFDLSPSMLATDVAPSRLVRARLKLIDLLRKRSDGETALVAYAGDAHRVAPLTEDARTIEALVPSLHPNIMPVSGSQIEDAVSMAVDLFDGIGVGEGDILLITDGVDAQAVDMIDKTLGSDFRLFILSVGSAAGAPIPGPDGGFIRDQSGEIVLAGVDAALLQTLAEHHDGIHRVISADDADIDSLTAALAQDPRTSGSPSDRRYDTRVDIGYWLIVLMLPMALLAFRRNVVWMVMIFILIPLQPQTAVAFEWQDLWLRPDQRGARALQRGDHERAAQQFENHDWSGVARFRGENYEAAAEEFAKGTTSGDYYNLGNAKAMSLQLDEALAAYDQALALEPDHRDALHNRSVVEQLLKQSEQQQSEQQQSEQQQSEQQQSEQQQSEQQQSEQQQSEQQDPLTAASEQWLRSIASDPGGLLRRKFDYQSRVNNMRGIGRNNEPSQTRY